MTIDPNWLGCHWSNGVISVAWGTCAGLWEKDDTELKHTIRRILNNVTFRFQMFWCAYYLEKSFFHEYWSNIWVPFMKKIAEMSFYICNQWSLTGEASKLWESKENPHLSRTSMFAFVKGTLIKSLVYTQPSKSTRSVFRQGPQRSNSDILRWSH